jgi:hypothetical protein
VRTESLRDEEGGNEGREGGREIRRERSEYSVIHYTKKGGREGGREGRDVPPENFLVMRIGSQLSLSDK